VLGELSGHGLGTTLVPLFLGGQRYALAELVGDPAPRRCPTPVGTDAWLHVLGYGGTEEIDEALR